MTDRNPAPAGRLLSVRDELAKRDARIADLARRLEALEKGTPAKPLTSHDHKGN